MSPRRVRFSPLVLCLLLISGLFTVGVGAGSAQAAPAAGPSAELNVLASSNDAYARYQTLTYRSAITRAGTLTSVVMSLPTGAFYRAKDIRSSSGTLSAYTADKVIWRPRAPIAVAVGARLVIPVTGINYGAEGTTALTMQALDATGRSLSATSTPFTITNTPANNVCQTITNNYITSENARVGSPRSEWQIASSRFNPNIFAGYSHQDSYRCGDIAYFKLMSTKSTFSTVKVYRMGYYHGDGAREVWSSAAPFLTDAQPAYKVLSSTGAKYKNMVYAGNWNINLGIRIDGRFTPGTYLAKFRDTVGHETYVPFTVRDDSGLKHDYLLQQATTTWQAYNKWGGYSFYTRMPNNSSRLSFDRPYAEPAGKGSGQFLQLENGLVYHMEQRGYDVAYWTDTDLQLRGASLPQRTRTLVLPAHDEYYSAEMRNTLLKAINTDKVNLISFGANQVHRHIFWAGSRGYDVRGAFTAKTSTDYVHTAWRSEGADYSEQVITGAQYGSRAHGTVVANDSWLFRGIKPGTAISGLINGEADYQNTTEKAYLLGYQVPKPSGSVKLTPDYKLDFYSMRNEAGIMNIVARTTPAGAKVYSGSTFAYACFLNKSCYSEWQEGKAYPDPKTGLPTYAPLVVSDADSENVATMVDNVLMWAKVPGLPRTD